MSRGGLAHRETGKFPGGPMPQPKYSYYYFTALHQKSYWQLANLAQCDIRLFKY